MFPDISCDDIFRLETPRLWLRWLRVGDATAVAALPGARSVLSEAPGAMSAPNSGEVERFILAARTATASGDALVLGATGKAKTRTLVGVLAAHARNHGELELRSAFAPTQAGRELAGEALAALADTCFNLTNARTLFTSIGDEHSKSDDLYDRLGFATGADTALVRLERHDWARGRAHRLPDMPHQVGRDHAPRSRSGDGGEDSL